MYAYRYQSPALFLCNTWGNFYPWFLILDRIPIFLSAWLLHKDVELVIPRLTRRRVIQCAFIHLITAIVYTVTVLSYAGTFGKPILYQIDSSGTKVLAAGIVGAVWAAILAMIYYIAAAMRILAWASTQPILGSMTMGYTAVPSMKIEWDEDRFVGQKPVNVRKFAIGRYDGWVV